MKIAIAQVKPDKGNIESNIENHKRFIDAAASQGADIIVFPELSLTGYEPKLSKELATGQDDVRLDVFQTISDQKQIVIGVGLPTTDNSGVQISMILFQPNRERLTYSKQHLHADEIPYFVSGQNQVILTIDNQKIVPAICYESLLPDHSEKNFKNGGEIYIASVAKPLNRVRKAFKHYPGIAKQYSITVLMANSIGECDDFISAGKSSIWNKNGELTGQLNGLNEGILMVDTVTEETLEWII